MRKIRKIKRLLFFIICVVVIVAISSCGLGSLDDVKNYASSIYSDLSSNITEVLKDENDLYGPYTVTRVVDGDTIVVKIDGEDVKVRLIGVNTPESVSNDESENCDEGVTASNYMKGMLTGESVYLEYDTEQYDKYGRELAYVYWNDIMVNRMLIMNGYATVMTIEPNTKYADMFKKEQENAKDNKIGFWGSSTIWS